MDPLATQLIEHDRGLGTAYERWCFYQLVDEWARRYDVTSALEGPVDGMAGVSGVHLVGLARRGVRVTSASLTDDKVQLARGVYERAGAVEHLETRLVGDPSAVGTSLQPADLVVVYHALPLVDDWRTYLQSMAKLARKLLVVTVCNPDNWGVAAIRAAGRLRGRRDLEPPETWKTEVLAPVLWEIGHVRDHVYFDAPWWPDLQVAPGQSLLDRAKQMLSRKRGNLRFTAEEHGASLAERFVYGSAKWPYFGGDGWVEELLPALLRHPGFDGTRWRWQSRVAHLHGFVVDVRPRTPQQRRRLTRAA